MRTYVPVAAFCALNLTSLALGSHCVWVYHADQLSLPPAQGWGFTGTTQAGASASTGVLVYGPTSTSARTTWASDVPENAMDFTKFSWSISADVKLTGSSFGNVSGYRRGGFVLYLSDKNGRWIVADLGSATVGIRNDDNGTSDPSVAQNLSDGFHIVTLEAGPSGGKLFIDGVQKLSLPLGSGGTHDAATFGDGSNLASSQKVEIRKVELIPSEEPCLGDVDCNTFVDDLDFSTFVYGYNLLDCADPTMTSGCPADLNYDGIVDDVDFSIFVNRYDQLVCFPE